MLWSFVNAFLDYFLQIKENVNIKNCHSLSDSLCWEGTDIVKFSLHYSAGNLKLYIL